MAGRRLICALVAVTVLATGCGRDGPATTDADGCRGGGARWVFATDTGVRTFDVFIVTDGEVKRLTRDRKSMQPAISPDGSRIAFTKVTGSDMECCGPEFTQVYTMDAAGTGARPLTPGRNDGRPSFAPDGEYVAYLREWGGWDSTPRPDLMVVPADGAGEPRLLAEDLPENATPRWSPDGRSLAFVGPPEDGTIVVVDVATGQSRSVEVDGPTFDHMTWAPDGGGFIVDFAPMREEAGADTPVGLYRVGRDGAVGAPLGRRADVFTLLPDGRLGTLAITGSRAKPRARLESVDLRGGDAETIADLEVHYPYNAVTIGAGRCAKAEA